MKFVLSQSLLQDASSQNVSKNLKIKWDQATLPKTGLVTPCIFGPLGVKFDALNRWSYVVKFDVFEVNHNQIQVMLWCLMFLLISTFFHVMTLFFTTLFSSSVVDRKSVQIAMNIMGLDAPLQFMWVGHVCKYTLQASMSIYLSILVLLSFHGGRIECSSPSSSIRTRPSSST
jgi:hypothetical protein